MIETATELSQKLNTELSEVREKQEGVECQKRKLIEKKLRRNSTSYEKAKIECLATKAGSKKKKKKSNTRNTTATT